MWSQFHKLNVVYPKKIYWTLEPEKIGNSFIFFEITVKNIYVNGEYTFSEIKNLGFELF